LNSLECSGIVALVLGVQSDSEIEIETSVRAVAVLRTAEMSDTGMASKVQLEMAVMDLGKTSKPM
jgi:hypothetical protein